MHLPIIQHAGCRIQIKHFNNHPVCYPYLCKPISPAQIFSVVLYNSLEAVTYAELLLTVFINILRAEQYKRGDIMLATLKLWLHLLHSICGDATMTPHAT